MEFILEPLYKILAQVGVLGYLAQICAFRHKVERLVNSDFPLPLKLLSFALLSSRMVITSVQDPKYYSLLSSVAYQSKSGRYNRRKRHNLEKLWAKV